jgi:hypothetical protein
MPGKSVRVVVLVTLLAVVALWGWGRTLTRRARTEWLKPLAVAVFVCGDVGDEHVASLRASLDAVGRRLTEERDRYLPGREGAAVEFALFGPIRPERQPPAEPPGAGWLDRLLHAVELSRAERSVFAAARTFDPALADVRIHVLATRRGGAAPFSAEGIGALEGEVGIVRATFDAQDAFLAATAAVHETLHTLGATDKYDAAGHAVAPDGMAEPERVPGYPQRFAEIMVGEVPTGPATGRLPTGPGELAIGPVTAAEIGWLATGEASVPARDPPRR